VCSGVARTRRRFLQVAGTATGAALVYLRGCGYDDTAFAAPPLARLSPREGVILAAVVSTMLPPDAARDPGTLSGHVRAIDAYLVGLPAADVDQIGQCLTAVEQATLPFGGHFRRFTALDPAARAEVLTAWQVSSVGLLRLGFRSLKALVFLAYYRSEASWRPLRYAGPVMPGGGGAPEVRARYDALLAPAGARPR
jgi:hypothetical protein